MNKVTESKIFRKAKAGYDIAKIAGVIFWMPILVIVFLYFFMT